MPETKYVVFQLGKERYGLPIDKVERILPTQSITKIPRTPKMLLGMFDLRGSTIPVLDARLRFDLDENGGAQNLVVIQTVAGRCALRVDSVEGIFGFDEDHVDPSQTLVDGDQDEFVEGIGRREDKLVVLLNPDQVVPKSLRTRCAA